MQVKRFSGAVLWLWLLLSLAGTPLLGQWHAIEHGSLSEHAALTHVDHDKHADHDDASRSDDAHQNDAAHNCAAFHALTLAAALYLKLASIVPPQLWLHRQSPLPLYAWTAPPPQHYSARAPPVFS